MNERDTRALEHLRELGSRPAVPFFEDGPSQYILETLHPLGVGAQRDAYGNVIAHYDSTSQTSGPAEPPIAFVAHMDHPGFEIFEPAEGGSVARALGGVPVASLRKPTPVLVLTPDGQRAPAKIFPFEGPATQEGAERLVTVRLKADAELRPPVPVIFDLPDYALDGDTIRMRAVDDLAGCASILASMERWVSEEAETDVYAVFTRAEEAGLLGARLVAEGDVLLKETLVVSVESSAVIPGVAQVLIAARESIREQNPEFRCQRQLMRGGTCEATAFAVFGYRATGIAFPLGNYHNATTTIPDPDGGVGAEYIELSDFLGGVELIAEAARSVAARAASPTRRWVRQVPDEVRKRLEDTAG